MGKPDAIRSKEEVVNRMTGPAILRPILSVRSARAAMDYKRKLQEDVQQAYRPKPGPLAQ